MGKSRGGDLDDPVRNVTGLLRRSREGDSDALERLMPVVYGELRRLASRYMSGERRGHTFDERVADPCVFVPLVGQHGHPG